MCKINLTEICINALVSILIAFCVAHLYYKIATKDLERVSQKLEKETQRIQELNETMLIGMEQNKWIELSRDKEGRILGFKQIIPSGIPSGEAFGKPALKQE